MAPGDFYNLDSSELKRRPGRVLLTALKSTTHIIGPTRKSSWFISWPGFGPGFGPVAITTFYWDFKEKQNNLKSGTCSSCFYFFSRQRYVDMAIEEPTRIQPQLNLKKKLAKIIRIPQIILIQKVPYRVFKHSLPNFKNLSQRKKKAVICKFQTGRKDGYFITDM